MKKYLSILTILTGVSIAYAGEVMLDTKTLETLKKNNLVLQDPNIQQIEGIDRQSYYFLQLSVAGRGGMKKVNAFIEKATGALYTGNRYGKDSRADVFPVSDALRKVVDAGVAFSSGNGAKQLYVLTDPECRYCIKFETQALGKLKDYTVHTILYPLSTHGNSPMMVEWILQGADDKARKQRMDALMIEHSNAWQSVVKNGTFQYSSAVADKVQKAHMAGRALGIRGTPTVLDGNFNKINWMQLLQGR